VAPNTPPEELLLVIKGATGGFSGMSVTEEAVGSSSPEPPSSPPLKKTRQTTKYKNSELLELHNE